MQKEKTEKQVRQPERPSISNYFPSHLKTLRTKKTLVTPVQKSHSNYKNQVELGNSDPRFVDTDAAI